jgi:HAMP domain-containing protein
MTADLAALELVAVLAATAWLTRLVRRLLTGLSPLSAQRCSTRSPTRRPRVSST